MTEISTEGAGNVNAMTVDVEDYFQVSAFEKCIPRADWDRWPQRVERNTERVLELFDANDVKATFFVLGWVAERFPQLIRRIVECGHEVANHGYGHERLTSMTREQFRADISRAKGILEGITGHRVLGYRAPSYSVGLDNLWAHEELRTAGYRYSSSIVPIHHDLYGIPHAPRFAFFPGTTGLLEVPVTTVALLGRNWPCGGGGFFRLLPYPLFRKGWQRVNRHDGRAGVFYFHPWELDPEQPRVPGASFRNRVRHYLNLERMVIKLGALLRDFRFDRMDRIFLEKTEERYPVVALEKLQLRAREA